MEKEYSKLKYRPDIDGLRAVAVLSVLAFHLGWSKIPGGYVGVDVFFVISGYLISSIIFSEVAAGRFSVIAFYERRIRRIFPALFGMLIVSSIFAWIYLLPDELVNFCKSMLSATASASNFYFWEHSGYFDLPITQPLLHTWSLAVEEQFYLTFPAIPASGSLDRAKTAEACSVGRISNIALGQHLCSRKGTGNGFLYALYPGVGAAFRNHSVFADPAGTALVMA